MQTVESRAWRRPLLAASAALLFSAPALAQVTFYENRDFEGRSLTAQGNLPNLARNGFNDRASSAVVRSGQWEICEDSDFQGRCAVLRPGQYATLSSMGMNDRVSSVRRLGARARIDDDRYAPQPVVAEDYRRRDQERLFEAHVDSARAVYDNPPQRCWTEHEQMATPERSDNRVPGALFGAVIGGILGHQVGGGRGRDLATVGGAVAGAAIGSNAGRDRSDAPAPTRDVQRCAPAVAATQAAYWEVTYEFRGRQHQVQLATPPGATIQVNRDGEPRA